MVQMVNSMHLNIQLKVVSFSGRANHFPVQHWPSGLPVLSAYRLGWPSNDGGGGGGYF